MRLFKIRFHTLCAYDIRQDKKHDSTMYLTDLTHLELCFYYLRYFYFLHFCHVYFITKKEFLNHQVLYQSKNPFYGFLIIHFTMSGFWTNLDNLEKLGLEVVEENCSFVLTIRIGSGKSQLSNLIAFGIF